MKSFIAGLTLIVGLVALLFAAPLLGLLVGLFFGWVLELFTGAYVTDGLNLLLGTDRFERGDLPQVLGVLGVVGGFFRAKVTTKKEAA